MNRNNPRLKLYIMLDASNRKVPGTARLAFKKPKNGRWVEESAYECCDTTTTTTSTTTTTTTAP